MSRQSSSILSTVTTHLSTRLSLDLLLLATPLFVLVLGLLFLQSRHIIRNEAVGRANSVLNATLQRVFLNISTTETANNAFRWQAEEWLHPDSLLAFSRRTVLLNAHIDGCAISVEPDIFPQYGRYFSAYTIRKKNNGKDSLCTVVEEEYEYFDRIWYKTPHDLGKPCWTVYYDDIDSLDVALDGLLACYSAPLFDKQDRLVGIISIDLSLLRLSKSISEEEKPYPHSYFALIGDDGRYLIHPDTTRLFKQTIFSDTDPRHHTDLIALGHEMTAGNEGSMAVDIGGTPCLVCYKPLPGTNWSLALVCPDDDVLAAYHRQAYIIAPLLIIGIIIILLLCYRTVSQAIMPINQLLDKTQSIIEGNTEVYIPRSKREDAVGRLQNSFATMLQSLNFHTGSVRYTTERAKQQNEGLAHATQLAEEADRQKTAFIQNVSHQIRTPLNIIMGFTQILKAQEGLSEEEMKVITDTLQHNSSLLHRLVLMLFDSSETAETEEQEAASKHDIIPCNEVAREAIHYININYPDVSISLTTDTDDDFCIQSSRLYLMRSLREILYNAAKYSDGQHVKMTISHTDTAVFFTVEDRGKGIAEADRERIFKFFAKVDDLSEGLGLGLPLSKRHARNLGGNLTLDEGYHDGCRFVLEIPIHNS
ncbi:MAG: histidine kinase [Prevotella sp.]|nr:histidine kinase [Prevotella sp.]